jgi:hypothetical protein
LQRPSVDERRLARWCEQWLGARPAEILFDSGHLSTVVGVRLADDRQVVVKVRPHVARIAGCVEVQRHLHESGFPCPMPLAGPSPFGAGVATAEVYVPGGTQLDRGGDSPERFAELLWQLIDRCADLDLQDRLDPPPLWVAWDHTGAGVWPPPGAGDPDLNAEADPHWLKDVAEQTRKLLIDFRGPSVVGHVDWESQNIRWKDGQILVVHDWDSAASRPEATIAGAASAVFARTGAPGSSTLPESELFLDAYERARGRAFSRDERRAAWAAGLWVRASDTKENLVTQGEDPEPFADEAWERLRRATT